MIRLLKWELRKEFKYIIIALVVLFIAEIAIYPFFYKGYDSIGIGLILFLIVGVVTLVYCLIININLLMRDLLFKKGYLLFLTDNNGYKIIGSKAIVGLLESILLIGTYGALFIKNYKTIFNTLDMVDTVMGIEIDLKITLYSKETLNIIVGIIVIVLAWYNVVLSIYLAMTLYKCLKNSIKYPIIVSSAVGLAINFIVFYIYKLTNVRTFTNNIDTLVNSIVPNLLLVSAIGVVQYLVTGYLVQNKIDL